MQKEILIYVGADCLGDAIQKIPYINALRQAFPQHRLVWFANMGSVFTGLLKEVAASLLDEVISDVHFSAGFNDIFRNPFLGTPLAGRHFDYIFDTQKRWKQTLILKKLPHRLFISGCAGFLFSDIKPKRGYRESRNVTKRLIEMTELVVAKKLEMTYRVPLPQRFLDEAQKLLPVGRQYLGFVPCGSVESKKWPLEKYIQLALKYLRQDFQPVFFLGPDEQEDKQAILDAIPSAIIPAPMVVDQEDDLYGPLYYMSLGQQLVAIIANDCGPGHLLNCANRPMLFLFGPTDAEKFAPAREDVTVLQSKDWGDDSLNVIPLQDVYQSLSKYVF